MNHHLKDIIYLILWRSDIIKTNNVYVGDNIEVLKTFPDNSIDSVVTDPPYGLGKEPNAIEVLQSWITTGYHEVKGKGFMGKEWDAFVPQPNFWKEIYRVLKPGGYVLSFAGTRTYDWMVMAVRLAGFEVRDMIAWLYGSGFPKSMDVSKAIDKKLGAEREVIGKDEEWIKRVGKNHNESNTYTDKSFGMVGKNGGNITAPSTDEAKQWQGWGTALKPALEPIVMARKPLDGTVAQNVLKHGVGGINIDDCRIPFGNETDNRVGTDAKRGDSKKYKYNNVDYESFKDYENDADLVWSEKTSDFRNIDDFYEFLEDYHFYKPKENLNLGFDIFDYEFIVIDNTERKNVIPLLDTFILNSDSIFGQSKKGVQMYENNGRFPANVIHDGSDEVVSLFPETGEGSGNPYNYSGVIYDNKNTSMFNGDKPQAPSNYNDSGSAARFFYTAKASKEERNFGLYDFETYYVSVDLPNEIENDIKTLLKL